MKKIIAANKIISMMLCLVFALSMVGCGSKSEAAVPKDAAYLVTYSSMFIQKGGFYYVSANGDILSKNSKLKMQDLSRFEVKNDRVIISGERHNNTVIFNSNSSAPDKDFLFLNKSQYSGVTAIASDGDNVLGIMNGNFSGGVYKDLLVLQSLSGEVLRQTELDIFAHGALYSQEETIVAGAYIEMGEASLITVAEIIDCSDDEPQIYRYDEFNGFWDIVSCDGILYCLTERKDDSRDTVVLINQSDFSVIAIINMTEALSNLFIYKDSVYVVGTSGIYVIEPSSGEAKIQTAFDEIMSFQDGYAYFGYELEGKAYVFLRYAQRQKENGNYIYGKLVCIDLESSDIQVTQIKSAGKNKVDTLFVIPAAFFQ